MFIKEGINASPGVAIATAHVYEKCVVEVNHGKVDDTQREIEKFQGAITESRKQIEAIQAKAIRELGEEEAAIFGAHIMVLEDPEFVDGVEAEINENHLQP